MATPISSITSPVNLVVTPPVAPPVAPPNNSKPLPSPIKAAEDTASLEAQTKSRRINAAATVGTAPTAAATTAVFNAAVRPKFDITQASVVDANQNLSADLLKLDLLENPNNSAMNAPFGIMLVLGMLLNIMSDSEDSKEMMKRMGFHSYSNINDLNDVLQQITNMICTKDSKAPFVNTANAVGIASGEINSSFLAILQEYFSAEVFSIKKLEDIVNWVKTKITDPSLRDKIAEMMSKSLASKALGDIDAAIINVLNFNALWTEVFKAENVSPLGIFQCLDGSQFGINVMTHKKKKLNIRFENDYTAVVLDYNGTGITSYKYVTVIPNDPEKASQIADQLPQIIKTLLNYGGTWNTKINFHFPEQVFNHSAKVFPKLKKLQFPVNALLDKLMKSSKGMRLTDLDQDISGKVDRLGTSFVASTYGSVAKCLPPPESMFKIDATRPFFGVVVASYNDLRFNKYHVSLLSSLIGDGKFLTRGTLNPAERHHVQVVDTNPEILQKEHKAEWDGVNKSVIPHLKVKQPVSCKEYKFHGDISIFVVNYTNHEYSLNRYLEPLFNGQQIYFAQYLDENLKKDIEYRPIDCTKENCIAVIFEKDGKVFVQEKDFNKDPCETWISIEMHPSLPPIGNLVKIE